MSKTSPKKIFFKVTKLPYLKLVIIQQNILEPLSSWYLPDRSNECIVMCVSGLYGGRWDVSGRGDTRNESDQSVEAAADVEFFRIAPT